MADRSNSEDTVILCDREKLDKLGLEEGQFAIDLVHGPRVVVSGVIVWVLTDLLKCLPSLVRVRLRIRRR